jgi:subtilisin family serine protease
MSERFRRHPERLSPVSKALLAVAMIWLATHASPRQESAQVHAQARLPRGSQCTRVVFDYPLAQVTTLQPEAHFDQWLDDQTDAVSEAAEAFSEGLAEELNFDSLDTQPVGFADVCDEDDRSALESRGAVDIEEVWMAPVEKLEGTQDPNFPDPELMQITQPQHAWEKGATGDRSQLTNVIIDTGVDTTHPELQGRLTSQMCFSYAPEGFESTCPNGQAEDDSAHITDPAALHGGATAGVAISLSQGGVTPVQVAIREVKPEGNLYHLSGEDIYRAYDAVVRSDLRVAAVSASYGHGGYTSTEACRSENPREAALIKNIIDKGVVFVAASGNESGLNYTAFPACLTFSSDYIDGFVPVASTTDADDTAFHANMAPWVLTGAPGEGITSLYPDGQYASYSGTSMAAPAVAAAVQVIRDMYISISPADIERLLVRGGVAVRDTRQAEGGYTNGLILSRLSFPGISNQWYFDWLRSEGKTFDLSLPLLWHGR